jgi:hypothetical protein
MMPLFLLLWYFLIHTYIQSIIFIQYIHPSPFAEVPLRLLIASQPQWEKNLPRVPRRESNPGLPYSKPGALLSELRRTLIATPHPKSYAAPKELRHTLWAARLSYSDFIKEPYLRAPCAGDWIRRGRGVRVTARPPPRDGHQRPRASAQQPQ